MRNKIGLNIHSGRINGDLELLKRDIRALAQAGFDVAEIPVHGVDAVVNGHLRVGRAKQVKEILNGFDLEYTVHAPDRLNLRDFQYPDVHRKVFAASIQFTAAIGAKTFVYHQGRLKSNDSDVTEEEAREIEVDELSDLGKLATSEGVTVCVENIHSSITHLMKLLESVGEESVKMCYDFAHSYINSKKFGYDFLRSVQLAKPYIRHAHVNDNFGKGKPESAPPYIEAMPLGIGDLHLPIGWGCIPYEDVFRAMAGYDGIYILELQERFFENGYSMLKGVLQDLREMLERVEAERVESAGQADG
ncbi:sugar phosphate isomerase/epimerase [Candidatus Bipolaricaulota bacterium]|nr:sugar phosphate isomerase/epimerase [Candidatus Bipolaricaulota bacterium]